MKTAEQKAEEVCRKLNLPIDGPAFNSICRALKEQDRDTRHACAEAVLECPDDAGDQYIWKDDAHNACMNVKSV